MVVQSWWNNPDEDGGSFEDVNPRPSPSFEVVAGEHKSEFGRVTLFVLTGMLLSVSWAVVLLSMFLITRFAESYGVSPQMGRVLAFPAVLFPIWKTIQIVRSPSLMQAMMGHLWVLNGGAGWAILVLGGLWWLHALKDALHGSQFSAIMVLTTAGFVPMFAGLVMFNRWIFRRAQGK
ncbi:MAG: hypothetical protein NTZ05_10085 [Chloroflexi bacterium]|nr:hypothetical protein [Chloroflexota bacterium]